MSNEFIPVEGVVPANPGFTRVVFDHHTNQSQVRHVVAWVVKTLPKPDPAKPGPDPIELQAVYAPLAFTYKG